MPKEKSIPRNATNNWWNFTINNYSEEEYESVRALFHDKKLRIDYIVVGKERGDSNTPHLQGFVAFGVRKKFDTLKKLLGDRAHVEPVRVTPDKAAAYCKKDGDFFEKGKLPEETKKQGSRSDIHAIKDRLDAGASTWDLAQESYEGFSTISRAHKFFLGYETSIDVPRNFQSQVYVFYGSSGTFKSTAAHRFRELYTVVRPRHAGEGVWFDGYEPNRHLAVLFDDFYGWMPYNNLLELLDRYGARVQVKGGTLQWKPQSICITSNTSPERWYKQSEFVHFTALQRRLAHVFCHTRVEASNDARGLAVGDVTVTCEQGSIECHPLRPFMTDKGDGIFLLEMAPELNTQMEVDMQIAFTQTALIEEPINSAPPSSKSSSPLEVEYESISSDD